MEDIQTNPPMNQAEQGKLMAALAYVGPLIIVSYIMAKDNAFVKFHIKQALVLVVAEAVLWVTSSMFWSFWPIINLINFAIVVLAIFGIINAVKGKEKELPLVGKFSQQFPL